MAAKVPTTESGRARLGMIVADTLRRKAKITSTTSTSAASMVSFTSRTEARMDCERSNRISTCTEGGSHALKVGRSAVTASATSTVLRSEEHTSELQSLAYLVCRLLLEKKKKKAHSD